MGCENEIKSNFVKREENVRLLNKNVKNKLKKEEEERLAQLTVDEETGEILDGPDDNKLHYLKIFQQNQKQVNLRFCL